MANSFSLRSIRAKAGSAGPPGVVMAGDPARLAALRLGGMGGSVHSHHLTRQHGHQWCHFQQRGPP